MTIPRISVAWLAVLLVVGLCLFFAYHIGRTVYAQSHTEEMINSYTKDAPLLQRDSENPYAPHRESPPKGPDYAPPSGSKDPAAGLPFVPGQTEEDLRATDPVQATAPAHRYQPPGPKDPHAGPAYEPAEFGDNLRHPEGMFEIRPAPISETIVSSGMGSSISSPGGNSAIGYSREPAQNAGEFMKGIYAFDGSMEGTAYSAL
jgi:hypothetical protein